MVFEAVYRVEADNGIILFDLPASLEELLAMGREYQMINTDSEGGKDTWVELLLPRDFFKGSSDWSTSYDELKHLGKDCTHYLAYRYDKPPRFNQSTWDNKTYPLGNMQVISGPLGDWPTEPIIGWVRHYVTFLNLDQTRLMWPSVHNPIAGTRYVRGYKLQLNLEVLQEIYNRRPFIRGIGVLALEEDFWKLKAGEKGMVRLKAVYGTDASFFDDYFMLNYPQGGVL